MAQANLISKYFIIWHENKKRARITIVSMETAHMEKSQSWKNQSKRSDVLQDPACQWEAVSSYAFVNIHSAPESFWVTRGRVHMDLFFLLCSQFRISCSDLDMTTQKFVFYSFISGTRLAEQSPKYCKLRFG